jgi:hypothetical protein
MDSPSILRDSQKKKTHKVQRSNRSTREGREKKPNAVTHSYKVSYVKIK